MVHPRRLQKLELKKSSELADLLYMVEELNHKGDIIFRKGVLLQGKNTVHPRKIDSGNSTRKERALFEKLDRRHELTLNAGVSRSSKIIGNYLLDSNVKKAFQIVLDFC